MHQHFPARTSLAAKNRYSILRRKHDGIPASSSRGSSSVRHAKSSSSSRIPNGGRSCASASATPPLSSSPYLGVTTTPSTTALSTPEPEFAGVEGDWMALAAAEIDEMLYRGSQGVAGGGEEWFGTAAPSPSPSPIPLMGGGELDQGFGGLSAGWVQQQQQYQSMGQQQAGFDASLVDPRMCQGGFGNGEYYAQGQQELEVPGYEYNNNNMLGVYQGEVQIQVTQPGMYDGSSGLVSQGQVGSWQGGYTAAGW